MDHIYKPFTDIVEHWYVGRLEESPVKDRARRLVEDSVGRDRRAMGLPPVSKRDSARLWCGHPASSTVKDDRGVEVCSRCPRVAVVTPVEGT